MNMQKINKCNRLLGDLTKGAFVFIITPSTRHGHCEERLLQNFSFWNKLNSLVCMVRNGE
jgi:hypothetical protein